MTSGKGYTVAHAVRDWLAFGLSGKDEDTITKCKILAETHVIPALGARQLVRLSADDVDRWLADRATVLSTRSLYEVRSVLKRSITRAQARDKVKRNMVLLCEIPRGTDGRPSKSLTLDQAGALLSAAAGTPTAKPQTANPAAMRTACLMRLSIAVPLGVMRRPGPFGQTQGPCRRRAPS